MLEVTSISASSYDPESLTPMLDERVREGWEIISIVSAGTKVVAFLQRDGDGSVSTAAESEQVATAAAGEPDGWAAAPDDDSTTGAGAATAVAGASAVAATSEPATVEQPDTQAMPVQEAAQEPVAEPVPESTVPAGWYADPSGRFELRYWDGNAWTEHVSRAGQQYTDPPVA